MTPAMDSQTALLALAQILRETEGDDAAREQAISQLAALVDDGDDDDDFEEFAAASKGEWVEEAAPGGAKGGRRWRLKGSSPPQFKYRKPAEKKAVVAKAAPKKKKADPLVIRKRIYEMRAAGKATVKDILALSDEMEHLTGKQLDMLKASLEGNVKASRGKNKAEYAWNLARVCLKGEGKKAAPKEKAEKKQKPPLPEKEPDDRFELVVEPDEEPDNRFELPLDDDEVVVLPPPSQSQPLQPKAQPPSAPDDDDWGDWLGQLEPSDPDEDVDLVMDLDPDASPDDDVDLVMDLDPDASPDDDVELAMDANLDDPDDPYIVAHDEGGEGAIDSDAALLTLTEILRQTQGNGPARKAAIGRLAQMIDGKGKKDFDEEGDEEPLDGNATLLAMIEVLKQLPRDEQGRIADRDAARVALRHVRSQMAGGSEEPPEGIRAHGEVFCAYYRGEAVAFDELAGGWVVCSEDENGFESFAAKDWEKRPAPRAKSGSRWEYVGPGGPKPHKYTVNNPGGKDEDAVEPPGAAAKAKKGEDAAAKKPPEEAAAKKKPPAKAKVAKPQKWTPDEAHKAIVEAGELTLEKVTEITSKVALMTGPHLAELANKLGGSTIKSKDKVDLRKEKVNARIKEIAAEALQKAGVETVQEKEEPPPQPPPPPLPPPSTTQEKADGDVDEKTLRSVVLAASDAGMLGGEKEFNPEHVIAGAKITLGRDISREELGNAIKQYARMGAKVAAPVLAKAEEMAAAGEDPEAPVTEIVPDEEEQKPEPEVAPTAPKAAVAEEEKKSAGELLSVVRPPQNCTFSMVGNDAISLDNGTPIDSVPEGVASFLGGVSDLQTIAAACNAHDGSKVYMTVRREGRGDEVTSIMLNSATSDGGIRAGRLLRKDYKGNLVCINEVFGIPEKLEDGSPNPHREPGKGTRLLANQIAALKQMGVKKIKTLAGRSDDPKQPMNGYTTWPKLGYDGLLSGEQREELPQEIQDQLSKDEPTIQNLYAIKGGKEAWEEHGSDIDLTFDLTDGSPNMRVLQSYLEKKGIAGSAATKAGQGNNAALPATTQPPTVASQKDRREAIKKTPLPPSQGPAKSQQAAAQQARQGRAAKGQLKQHLGDEAFSRVAKGFGDKGDLKVSEDALVQMAGGKNQARALADSGAIGSTKGTFGGKSYALHPDHKEEVLAHRKASMATAAKKAAAAPSDDDKEVPLKIVDDKTGKEVKAPVAQPTKAPAKAAPAEQKQKAPTAAAPKAKKEKAAPGPAASEKTASAIQKLKGLEELAGKRESTREELNKGITELGLNSMSKDELLAIASHPEFAMNPRKSMSRPALIDKIRRVVLERKELLHTADV